MSDIPDELAFAFECLEDYTRRPLASSSRSRLETRKKSRGSSRMAAKIIRRHVARRRSAAFFNEESAPKPPGNNRRPEIHRAVRPAHALQVAERRSRVIQRAPSPLKGFPFPSPPQALIPTVPTTTSKIESQRFITNSPEN